MYTATYPAAQPQPRELRTALGEIMKFEVLINDKTKVWIFHDQALPGRLAWVEFDPFTGCLDLVPHDMRNGILYAEIPSMLHGQIRSSNLVYFYITEGDKVTGFQKVALHVRRQE